MIRVLVVGAGAMSGVHIAKAISTVSKTSGGSILIMHKDTTPTDTSTRTGSLDELVYELTKQHEYEAHCALEELDYGKEERETRFKNAIYYTPPLPSKIINRPIARARTNP